MELWRTPKAKGLSSILPTLSFETDVLGIKEGQTPPKAE